MTGCSRYQSAGWCIISRESKKRHTRCAFSIADKSSACTTECPPAYVRAIQPLHLSRDALLPLLTLSTHVLVHRGCIVDASCVMTSNDRECVNPESRTNTAIGRSENGLALGQNQSGSYFARDRRCRRTSDLENGMHD